MQLMIGSPSQRLYARTAGAITSPANVHRITSVTVVNSRRRGRTTAAAAAARGVERGFAGAFRGYRLELALDDGHPPRRINGLDDMVVASLLREEESRAATELCRARLEMTGRLLEEREHMPDACLVAILARQMIRGHLISVGRIKLGAVCHGREKLYAIDMTLARRMMQSSLPVLVHCGTICTRLEQQGDHLGMARRGRVVEERGTVLCVGSTLGSFGLRRQEGTHPFCGAECARDGQVVV